GAGGAGPGAAGVWGGEGGGGALGGGRGGGGEVRLRDEPLAALDARTRADAAHALLEILRESEAPAILVTHDFADAALLAQDIAVVDRGRLVQRGSASSLAATPASAFVASFAGAVVLTGVARPGGDGLTAVELDGGGELSAAGGGPNAGPVAVSIYPWEIVIERPRASADSGAQNRLPAQVVPMTRIGSRVRVGLQASQPLAAEITQPAARELALAVGSGVIASWKATATRLIPL